MKSISILFLFLIIHITSVIAQVQLTDFIPDTIVDNNEIFFLDINQDGIDDFKFMHEDSAAAIGLNGNGIGVKILHLEAEFMGGMPPQDPTHYYPYHYGINTPIDSSAFGDEWVVQHPQHDMIRVLNLQFSTGSYAGLWINNMEAYLGVRVKQGGMWHYGWILMEVAANATQNRIKAFAWQQQPDSTILAGAGLSFYADTAQHVMGMDVSDYGDASDIQVSFTKATDESTIQEYRVVVVPSGVALPNFPVLPSNSYFPVIPNGQNVQLTLPNNQLDAFGYPIEDSTDYWVAVWNVPNPVNSNKGRLSNYSPIFQLLDLSSSIEELDESKLKISQDITRLLIESNNVSITHVNLYSIDGKEIVSRDIDDQQCQLNISELPHGVYIIHIQTLNDYITRKIII